MYICIHTQNSTLCTYQQWKMYSLSIEYTILIFRLTNRIEVGVLLYDMPAHHLQTLIHN